MRGLLLFLLLAPTISCTGTGEPIRLDGSAFDVLVIASDERTEVPLPEPPQPPTPLPLATPVPDRHKSLIVMDVGDRPGFWDAESKDRLPLELRLHPFGDTIHIELRNTSRDRIYWCGPDLEKRHTPFFGEAVDGELFWPTRCVHQLPESELDYNYGALSTVYTLGPGETYPLGKLELFRTTPERAVVWLEGTLWCVFVPVPAVIRAGLVLTAGGKCGSGLAQRFRFSPPDPDTGFPEIVWPGKLNNFLPATQAAFNAIPPAADRISNGIRIHPAEKPFEGSALHRTEARTPRNSRAPRGEGAPWRPVRPW